jgi:hypothetical protein
MLKGVAEPWLKEADCAEPKLAIAQITLVRIAVRLRKDLMNAQTPESNFSRESRLRIPSTRE